MNKLKKFIIATWELPQNFIGSIVKKIFKAEVYDTYKDATVYTWNVLGGMSLGQFIFIPKIVASHGVATNMIKHEYGHTIQSKYLGWFYLLVIGIPSLGWAWLGEGFRVKHKKSYYWFYTESWADKLGGVERED